MKNVFLVVIIGVFMTACAGVERNISADECGCPQNEQKTILSEKQKGISADECGCPQNDRKTILAKDKDPASIAD